MPNEIIFERRASTVLYNYLRSCSRPGKWLLPANVCPIVPAVFIKACKEFELVDINPATLCMDAAVVVIRLRKSREKIAGVLFARTYGHGGTFEPEFSAFKAVDPGVLVVDDHCLCQPSFALSGGVADLELYSCGYSKFVDLGWGGWGLFRGNLDYCRGELPFESRAHEELLQQFRKTLKDGSAFVCPNTAWLDARPPERTWAEFRTLVESRVEACAKQRNRLNAIYAAQLEPWAVPLEFRDWRFTIVCDCQTEIIKTIFDAGHFASSHYRSLAPMFGPGFAPVAERMGKRVVNLFNDFRYDENRAGELAVIIRDKLQPH